MFKFFIYFLWFICLCEAKDEEKVFGGRLARKGEFPATVAIISVFICGGLIFSLDKVLTAAHCMVDEKSLAPLPIEYYRIVGGSPSLSPDGKQERRIKSAKIHEEFRFKASGKNHFNDVALIILKEPFVESASLSVAKFLTKNPKETQDAWNDRIAEKKRCVGGGWGTTKYVENKDGVTVPGDATGGLKLIEMTPVDKKTCYLRGSRESDEDMTEKGEICLKPDSEKGESVCKGDSGSPLYCDGYAFGVLSAAIGCGYNHELTYYSLLAPFLDHFGLGIGPLLATNIHLVLGPSIINAWILAT